MMQPEGWRSNSTVLRATANAAVWFLTMICTPAGVFGQLSWQSPPGGTVHDVRHHGAAGDGIGMDTGALQRAVDSCAAAGGGTVLVPPGRYRTGTIVLRDHVTLHIAAGAMLIASERLEDYRPHRWLSTEDPALPGVGRGDDVGTLHLIYAERARGVAITGPGTIDGSGRIFWDADFRPLARPHQMIQFEACEEVRISGVTLLNAPFWAVNLLGCREIRIEGVTIRNYRLGPNTDGIDISSSSDVIISGCTINTGDDAICLKAPLKGRPTENILVTNCILVSDDAAVKLGTRSTGDIRNVVVSQCIIRDSNYGIALFMKDGGTYENLLFTDLLVETADPVARKRAVFPLYADLEQRTAASPGGMIRNVTFRGIEITSDGHSLFGGMPGRPIEALTLQDIRIRVPRPGSFSAISKPRGIRGLAPAADDFSTIPSTLTCAHVQNVHVRHLRVHLADHAGADARHVLAFRECSDIDIHDAGSSGNGGMLAMISLDRCAEARISGVRVPASAPALIAVEGANTRGIHLSANDLSASRAVLVLGRESEKAGVRSWNNIMPINNGEKTR